MQYTIYAQNIIRCAIPVEAESLEDAYSKIDGWIADDFEDYVYDNEWNFDAFQSEQGE